MVQIHYIDNEDSVNHLLEIFSNELPSLQAGSDYRQKMSEKFIEKGVVIASRNECSETVGFSAFYANDYLNKQAYLSMIAVKNMEKGRGVGTKLLHFTEIVAMEHGMESMRLEVRSNNTSAISFYLKNGYEFDGQEYDGSRYMIKELKSL